MKANITWSCCCHLQKLAAQAPSTRMGLRSFRSSLLIPMETSSSSSSSDDSCDSFGSDGGFANTVNMDSDYSFWNGGLCICSICDKGLCLCVFRGAARDGQGGWRRSQRCLRLHLRRTHAACLKRMWSTVRWNPWWALKKHSVLVLYHKLWKPLLTTSCIWFQKVNCEPTRPGRRSNVLKVAMTFPTKKTGKKRPASEPLPQSKVDASDSEGEEENFMVKRALNIKENKEMVLFLLRCIGTVPEFWPQQPSLLLFRSNLLFLL